MESQNTKKHENILVSYGIVILIYSFFSLLPDTNQTSKIPSLQEYFDWANHFFALTTISLFETPINFVIAYGLIKRRYWSRYAVIAAMATLPIHFIIQAMMWGTGGLYWQTILVSSLLALLTLFYFSSEKIRTLFGAIRPFRLRSWAGFLVGVIFLAALVPLIVSVVFKVQWLRKDDIPFFGDKVEIITLPKEEKGGFSEVYKKIRLIDTSLVIPAEFGIRRLRQVDEKSNRWSCGLYNTGGPNRGYVMYGNKFPYDELPRYRDMRKKAVLSSLFDTERFILTNNWNPGILLTKMLIRPPGAGFSIKEIHINNYRGFLKRWHSKTSSFAEFSLYSSDDRYTGGTFIYRKEFLGDNDILNILSSIEFLQPEDPQLAQSHYEKGLALIRAGHITQAQYELADAYYLSPKNPEFIFAFTKTLPKSGPNAYQNIKEMLDLILKIEPDYKEAQAFLKEIEPELQDEMKAAK